MKYKSSELELPPLGEIMAVKTEKNTVIGEFYINAKKERQFNNRLNFDLCYSCVNVRDGYKWSPLPQFKSIKKEKPPVGINVLMACASFYDEVLDTFVLLHFIKGQKKQMGRDHANHKEIEVDAWLPLEAFDED